MARVLLIGGGGREHALAWGLTRSSEVDELVCAPGNVGIAALGECRPVDASNPNAVVALADEIAPDLVVIGPEVPLVAGVVDACTVAGHLAFGPTAAAATLEGSKAWMKDVLAVRGRSDCEVPHVRCGRRGRRARVPADAARALRHQDRRTRRGQGRHRHRVDVRSARRRARAYLSGAAFGEAGRTCVIEEGLTGPELSVFVLCDGERAQPFATAQDHKRAFDGDQGPNTGGMGAYSPVPFVPDDLIDVVMDTAIWPTLREMQRRGAEYRGLLYCGLMLTADGPKVIEYNVRFGDPECQVIVPRLESDLYVHCYESAVGKIETPVVMREDACVALYLAAEGYPPEPTRTGDVIEGLDAAAALPGVLLFHAGTRAEGQAIVTNGGRVVMVSALGPTVSAARDRAYDAAARISWPGLHYRRDIAAQALL